MRVLKFDSGYAAEDCGKRHLIDIRRSLMIKLNKSGFRSWENLTNLAPLEEMHSDFAGWRLTEFIGEPLGD